MGHRIREAAPVGLLRHFYGAERSQMRRHELRIEHTEAAFRQPRDEMHERNFRRVGLTMKHAFAEKCRAKMDAVESPHKRTVGPAFHRVNMAKVEELAIKPSYAPIDPRLVAALIGGGAGIDHRIEVAIDFDLETIAADRFGKAFRDNKSIERKNATGLRIDPEKIVVRGAFRHREEADGIGAQQDIGGNLELVAGTAHRARLSAALAAVKIRREMDPVPLDKSLIRALSQPSRAALT
jgi:hypothetical protein